MSQIDSRWIKLKTKLIYPKSKNSKDRPIANTTKVLKYSNFAVSEINKNRCGIF